MVGLFVWGIIPVIIWASDTNSLSSSVLFQTPSSPGLPYVHSIKGVDERDRGMYTCVARNVVGRSHAAAYLQVNTGQPLMISKSVSPPSDLW